MRTVKRAVALAALLPCMAMAAPTTLASPALAQRAPAQAQAQALSKARAQVAMALSKVDPKSANEKSRIEISGLAKNRTDHQLSGLSLRLRYSAQPVTSRSQLDQYAAAAPNALPNVGPVQQLPGAAAPGVKQSWTFKTTVKQLGLRAPAGTPGVYPVGVEVLNSAQQVVGGITTFLTFMPKNPRFNPVSVGWVLPLADQMHRTNDQTFLDDDLAKDVAPGGRLHGLVDAAAATDAPVTWAIDPALLDDVRQMAVGDYMVRPPGAKKGVRKGKSAAAAAWLAALKNASKKDPYFTLPYADPDVVALVRRKTPRDIADAFAERNTGVATQVLGRAANARVAWPPAGAAGPGTVDQLAKNALKDGGAFLMSSSQFQNPATGALPNATTTLQPHYGDRKALLYDDKINQIVSEGSRSVSGGLLSEQRFLAETAMIAAEAPNRQRTLVVAPDRHWNPAGGVAKNLLKYTKKARWLRAVPLAKIESTAPQGRVFNGYSDDYQQYEIGDAHLRQVREIAEQAATFQAVMTGPSKISYERSVLRLESAAWRSSARQARAARNQLREELAGDMSKVRIVTTKSKRVLMGGSSGRLPVLIENRLPDQAVKVHLVATSENSAKLRLGRLEPEDAIIELQPGQKAQRWIPAQAAGNGNFHVQLELRIPGSPRRTYGTGESITVNVTGYGRLALLITGGGLAVLFVGVGVRAIRARRRRKAEAAGDGSTGMGSAGPGERGTGFPGPGFPGAGVSAAEFPGVPGAGPTAAGSPSAGSPTAGPAAGPATRPGISTGPAAGSAAAGAPPGSAPAAPGSAAARPPGAGAGAAGSAAEAAGPAAADRAEPGGIPEPAADGQAARRGEHRRRDRD
ncbi:hypothetical protein HUT06_43505 [Actinomadura sp. NAK00032]|uniref:DUF6049 family protein n=1 Tax=Actinomadura sp. NAK00032 TaxID=2742128 RepID=UPI001590E98F|nr:DUF6049 family protein [Actinomadura sp. NAK00032]QKW40056.1 hypothetical protein HUT06_43505 [Actinomadura sp. NAK00032]